MVILDFAGYESFKTCVTPRCSGAVLVYDITDQGSFESLELWIKKFCTQPICMALVGNKADIEGKRYVPTLMGRTFAQRYGMLFEELAAYKVSSLGKLNTLMQSLVEQWYRKEMGKEQISSDNYRHER